MGRSQTAARDGEETPVDDVRRIRERLDREAGGDVRRLMERSAKVAEKYVKLLDLKRVSLDDSSPSQRRRRIAGKRRRSRV